MTATALIRTLTRSLTATALLGAAFASQASVITFDTPVVTAATQTAGAWYTDRYAPAGFVTAEFDGDMRLKHSIAATDGANNRPTSFNSAFYNTQGRKLDLAPGTTTLSVDLYLDESWTDDMRRYAGLWGTAVDAADAISYYPILEYGNGTIQAWNGAVFIDTGADVQLGNWVNLAIALVGSNWELAVDNVTVATFGANGSERLANTILQGYNNAEGVDYDIYWDNLSASGLTGTVPTPGSLALVGLGLLALGAMRRQRA